MSLLSVAADVSKRAIDLILHIHPYFVHANSKVAPKPALIVDALIITIPSVGTYTLFLQVYTGSSESIIMDSEIKLKFAKEKITKNIESLQTELKFVDTAMTKLKREHATNLENIKNSKATLMAKIETHFSNTVDEVVKTFQKSFDSLEQTRLRVEESLKGFQFDLKSCWSFEETDNGTSASFVNKRKAYEMFLDSINTKHTRRNVSIDIKRFVEGHRDLLGTLIGTVERTRVPLNEYIIKTELVSSFDVSDQEINAIAMSGDSAWVCFDAKNIIEKHDIKGNLIAKKELDASVNDMVIDKGGNILFTSPDKCCVRKAELKHGKDNGSVKSTKLVDSELYLHGLCMSTDGLVVCATDKPNYSKLSPAVSELLIFDSSGTCTQSISLPFTGKIYRMIQNLNGDYVSSYPFEGVVSIVNRDGALIKISNGEINDAIQEIFKPSGVACDSNGNVFISDWKQHCVLIFDKNGHFLRKIGGDFNAPNAICVDKNDRIWIGDRGKISVWKLIKEYK